MKFLFVVLLVSVQVQAQVSSLQEMIRRKYNFAYLSLDEGLPHHFVDDIYKDKQGFLWFATLGGGLSRFDGYDFKYYHIASTPALSSNFVHKVCEDDFGRLWIASDGGINILDLSVQRMCRTFHSDPRLSDILQQPAFSVKKDSRGNIWVSSGSSLYKLSFKQDGSLYAIQALATEMALMPGAVAVLCEVDDEMWVGYNHCIYRLYTKDDQVLSLSTISEKLHFGSGTYISVLLKKENEIWIGTDRGLFRYNKNNDAIKHYFYDEHDPGSLSQNLVTDLAETEDRELLVATLKGLNFYNPTGDHFVRIDRDDVGMKNTLNCNFINCIVADGGMIWVGTEAGGVNYLNKKQLPVVNYQYHSDRPLSLPPNPVNAIHEDSKGDLWVGTVEGGLNKKIRGREEFIHFTSSSHGLSHNSVSAITSDNRQRLWVGTWGGGINLLDISRSPIPKFQQITPAENENLLMNFIGTLNFDSINNGVWIGSYRGIFFYDLMSRVFIKPDLLNREGTIQGVLGSLIDKNNHLWLGTSNGLTIIDLKSFQQDRQHFSVQNIRREGNNPKLHFLEKITCIYETRKGELWMGSNGYGLYRCVMDGQKARFTPFTTKNGLANDGVFGISEDWEGSLWIATNNGLSCYKPEIGRFLNYTTKDGLLHNQFYWNACYRSEKTGNIYLGSMEGLSCIDEKQVRQTESIQQVVLTKLLVLNKDIHAGEGKYISQDISCASRLSLHEKDKSFSIEFSSLHYENPYAVNYLYRLKGFDENWITASPQRRFASYTNLPPGQYLFQVRTESTLDDPDHITELLVSIAPFFYKTAWFNGIVLLCIVFLFYRAYTWRVGVLKKQKMLLGLKVERRTRDLEKQKSLLQEQANELSRQNEILKQQNEKISRQKAQLIKLSKEIQELTVDKLAFFTNITHEFRTPLTLITGPIRKALELSSNPKVIEQLDFVKRNSQYLLSLINQLMDFRKVESGNLTINKTSSNLEEYLMELVKPFEVFAEERGVSLLKRFRLPSPTILFDQDAMNKIITNLLANAIKFTPEQGRVTIYVASLPRQQKLYIGINDTGKGIDKEDLDRVFDRFYQSGKQQLSSVSGQSGTGIGLYLCRRLVELQQGEIQARNNRGKGCSFRVILPLEEGTSEQTTFPALSASQEDASLSVSQDRDKRPTILVVEDNPDMRRFICTILTGRFQLVEAGNGEEALEILNKQSVDFIVSDLMMPVMDGLELSRQVKKNFAISHIPFLILTAKTSVESQIEGFRSGIDEYLLKPFDETLLIARINNILENKARYQKQFSFDMNVDILNMEEESHDQKFLNKAIETVKAHYRDSYYEVSDFIEAMGISKSMLNKKMQSLTGQSAGQFIRNYRLNLARELILKNKVTRNMNISEIAYEVGFNDPKYFTRCFTRHFGITPSSLLDDNKS